MNRSRTITGVNLIPAHRRTTRSRRRRQRAWVVGGIMYIAIVLAACAALRLTWDRESRDLARRVEDAAAAVKQRQGEVAALRQKLTELTARRQNAKALMDQPDWSILLAALGDSVGEETVLRDIRLIPVAAASAAAPAGPSAHGAAAAPAHGGGASKGAATQPRLSAYTLELRGLCRSPSAVSRFVLRLQASGLFDGVKLVRTNRDAAPAPSRDGSAPQQEAAVNFELGCTIGDRVP